MYRVIAIIRPFRARAVLEALQNAAIEAGTVREVKGFGRQKSRLQNYLGSEYDTSFLPKVELTLYVSESQLSTTLRILVAEARTGRMGDGKVMVQRCVNAIDVNPTEPGSAASHVERAPST